LHLLKQARHSIEWHNCGFLAAGKKSELIDGGEAIAEATLQSKEAWSSDLARYDIHHLRFDPNQPLKLQVGNEGEPLPLGLPDAGLQLTVEDPDTGQGTVSLKLPWSKRDQRKHIPKETSLIKVPRDISKLLQEQLQKQAEGWLDGNERLPAAMVQLLEGQPTLSALSSELAKDYGQVSERLAGFLAEYSGITLVLQGPPGSGKSTVTGLVIAQLAK